jgi:hypothetical protein
MIHDLIPLLTALIPLLAALVWPFTILILVYHFREGIKNLIPSVREAKIGDVFLKFGQADLDVPTKKGLPHISLPKQIIASPTAKWQNVANLFWLGNDLEWTAQTVLRGAPKDRILHGLTQCLHHTSELGLPDSAPGQQLFALRSQVESWPETAMDRQWRNAFSEQIYSVIKEFSDLMKQHQPNFLPGPEL